MLLEVCLFQARSSMFKIFMATKDTAVVVAVQRGNTAVSCMVKLFCFSPEILLNDFHPQVNRVTWCFYILSSF